MKETLVTEVTVKKPKVKWTTPLYHPKYSVEPCPNCEFPEADAGICPECGWLAPDPTCPCRDHKRQRGEKVWLFDIPTSILIATFRIGATLRTRCADG